MTTFHYTIARYGFMEIESHRENVKIRNSLLLASLFISSRRQQKSVIDATLCDRLQHRYPTYILVLFSKMPWRDKDTLSDLNFNSMCNVSIFVSCLSMLPGWKRSEKAKWHPEYSLYGGRSDGHSTRCWFSLRGIQSLQVSDNFFTFAAHEDVTPSYI